MNAFKPQQLSHEPIAPDGVAELRDVQIAMSPYCGAPDLTDLAQDGVVRRSIDPVSVADLLRNAFVYPPHSIFRGVTLATSGFSSQDDMQSAPNFAFKFRDNGRRREQSVAGEDWVGTYHRMLCEAISASCAEMRAPWLLQSGGKDSTSLAIAAAEARPDTTCITYLGGREENEVESARLVAGRLGLRHEALVCDPGRAYDRYLALLPRMSLLTADFALLSYADLVTAISAKDGDGVIDGLGSDAYFGVMVDTRARIESWLARRIRLPPSLTELPLIGRSFLLCFLLSTLQMGRVERVFPGSRFTDAEIDALFGRKIADLSRKRLGLFEPEIASAISADERRAITMFITCPVQAFGKGLYTTDALSMRIAYPYCDQRLSQWVHGEVPRDQLRDAKTRTNKILVRAHIASRFGNLPYVAKKGSFRFDLCGLARLRFDQVHDYAQRNRNMLPGAVRWLERNRKRLDNKYHASKFYLLAVVLPWIEQHAED